MIKGSFVALVLGLSQTFSFIPASATSIDPVVTQFTSMIIYEIKLGGTATSDPTGTTEFVRLFNGGDTEISLNGWRLEYAKATFNNQYCGALNWATHSLNGSSSQTNLSGTLLPGALSAPISRQLNNNASGSLRLINDSNPDQTTVHDIVGWGTGAPCYDEDPASIPPDMKSLNRYIGCEKGWPIDTNNNLSDWFVADLPNQGLEQGVYKQACKDQAPDFPPDFAEDQELPVESLSSSQCEGIIISEILPNPASSDAGKEFIELYNTTNEVRSLDGCQLELSGSDNNHVFNENDTLQPGEYRAFYDSTTGLTLPNAAGGQIILTNTATELAAESYPASMSEDKAWALIGDTWQETTVPTPNAINELPPELEPEPEPDDEAVVLALCPEGKFRNPDTNRCKTIKTEADLVPCASNQERNPETNRCRSILAIGAALTPCKPNQERNLQTNRCRNILSASTELAACKEGQERNPETNRCRKAPVVLANTSANNTPTKSDLPGPVNYGVIGFVAAAALGYGAYEYRNDLANALARLRSRGVFKQSSK